MMEIIRSHAMAMPLDYLVTRLVSRLSISEGVLRLPSVFWSTLTIPLVYAFARDLLRPLAQARRAALFAALWVALSPVQVFYAQEMRFYAALGFFYWLAGLALLGFLRAPGPWRWTAAALALLVGVYFHPYVLLALVNGAMALVALALFSPEGKPGRWADYKGRGAALAAAGLPAIAGFGAYFLAANPATRFEHELFWRNASVTEFFLQAAGWQMPSFCAGTPPFGLWEALQIAFTALGLVYAARLIRKGDTTPWMLVALLVAIVLQMGAIVLLNLARGYFLIFRQAVHLAPALMIFAGLGLAALIEWIGPRLGGRSAERVALAAAALLLVLAALPRLVQVSAVEKSNARQVVDTLRAEGREPGPLLVIPGYEAKVYRVYFNAYERAPGQKIIPADLARLGEIETPGKVNYLVAPVTGVDNASILALGYRPLLTPVGRCDGSRALYARDVP
jgi:uncharacterized membrane protein